MIIRILPSLRNRKEWIDFCSRERSYCYVENPSALVDFQSTHLLITLTPSGLRDGKKAVKYSIGSPKTIKPAWDFIKGCGFDLAYMLEGLETIDFSSNARDNHHLGFCPEANVRKFFSKESSIISPDTLGTLTPLAQYPSTWSHSDISRLLANKQYLDLRSEKALPETESPLKVDADALLVKLIENPDCWHVRLHNQRVLLEFNEVPAYSLVPAIRVGSESNTKSSKYLPRVQSIATRKLMPS